MFQKITEKWQDILFFMKDEYELTDISYKTWLIPMRPFCLVDDKLYIIVSNNPKIVEIVTKKYEQLLGIAVQSVTGVNATPVFITEDESKSFDAQKGIKPRREASESENFDDLIRKKGLNPKFTFYSFVQGNSNALAHAASLAVAEDPGGTYKLLYLYGGVGLGKTHLMHAIAIYILQNNPKSNIIYTTSENFMNEYINSIRSNDTDIFRSKYRNADVLLIDDIQFIAGRGSTQEEFFNTFNTLYSNNKQIIISSDKPPKDINNLEERIQSRFEGGMMVDIQPPNFETRMAILRKKEEIEGYNIDDEVIKYIATNIKSNIRTLEGALQRIVFKSKLEKIPITAETAAVILKDVIGGDPDSERVTPHRIVSVVAEHYHLREDDILSDKKNKELAYPRQIIMYLCCELTQATQKEIGAALGGRDHSTIIHGRDKISKELASDTALQSDIAVLKKKLSP